MTEIMVQEAKKRGIERNPEYLVRLEQLRNELMVQALFKDEQARHERLAAAGGALEPEEPRRR